MMYMIPIKFKFLSACLLFYSFSFDPYRLRAMKCVKVLKEIFPKIAISDRNTIRIKSLTKKFMKSVARIFVPAEYHSAIHYIISDYNKHSNGMFWNVHVLKMVVSLYT